MYRISYVLVFSDEDTGCQTLETDDTGRHGMFNAFYRTYKSRRHVILYITSLILTQFMFTTNLQTRQHMFSTDRIYLHRISGASCHAVVNSGSNPKMINFVIKTKSNL